jgi:hypothetical protein
MKIHFQEPSVEVPPSADEPESPESQEDGPVARIQEGAAAGNVGAAAGNIGAAAGNVGAAAGNVDAPAGVVEAENAPAGVVASDMGADDAPAVDKEVSEYVLIFFFLRS